MSEFLLIGSILKSIALGLGNTAPSEVPEWAGYLGVVQMLLGLGQPLSAELTLLDNQLKEAVAAKRGLLPEQRAMWKAWSDEASARIVALAPPPLP